MTCGEENSMRVVMESMCDSEMGRTQGNQELANRHRINLNLLV